MFKYVCSVHPRTIVIRKVCIGNGERPETADPQFPPNIQKDRVLVGSRDSTTDIEKTYQKGAPSESDLIEA